MLRGMSVLLSTPRVTAPALQLPDTATATLDDDRGRLLGQCSLVKFSTTQAYLVLSEPDSKVDGKFVTVAEKETPVALRLVSVQEEEENRRLLPVYFQAHHNAEARLVDEHLVDAVQETVLGRFNLELKKNVTVDLVDEGAEWRDRAGFIVTDRLSFQQLVLPVAALRQQLQPASNVKISKVTDVDAAADFDQAVSGQNRSSYVAALHSQTTSLEARGKGGEVQGLLFGKGPRIFALFADSPAVAHSLLAHYVDAQKVNEVTLFSRAGVWTGASQQRQIHRRHTRAVPSNVKWDRVFALNMGVHLL